MFCAFSSSLREGEGGAAWVPVKPSERGSFMSNTQKAQCASRRSGSKRTVRLHWKKTVHQRQGKNAQVFLVNQMGSDGKDSS